MSALQRVEETYLGILRLVIIIASSLLLVAAIVFGVMAFSNMRGGEKVEPIETAVKSDDVINKVASAPEKQKVNPQANNGSKKQGSPLSTDANQPYYDRTSDAILKFINSYAKGYFDISAERLVTIVKEKAEKYGDRAQIVTAFASGMAETMEKGLANPAIIKRVEKPAPVPVAPPAPTASDADANSDVPVPNETPFNESPVQIVDELMGTYTQFFEEQQSKIAMEKARAAAEEIERKSSSMMQLYIAGGAFASFLFLVFISIVVKIERNLRNIGSLPPQPSKTFSATESSST